MYSLLYSKTIYNNNMLGNLVNSIPPITRIQLLIFSFVGGLVYSEYISRYDMYFNLEKILFSGQVKTLLILDLASYHKYHLH